MRSGYRLQPCRACGRAFPVLVRAPANYSSLACATWVVRAVWRRRVA